MVKEKKLSQRGFGFLLRMENTTEQSEPKDNEINMKLIDKNS